MMNVIKKMDDIGRIAIPKDIRRSMRWMGGDEIEIILNKDNSLTLRKHEDDTVTRLNELRSNWQDDLDVDAQFLELIELIESRKNE